MNSVPCCNLDVEKYFYDKEWESMSELEQNRSRNLLGNYSALLTFGFNPEKPDFIIRYEQRLQEQYRRKQIKIAEERKIAKRTAALNKSRIKNNSASNAADSVNATTRTRKSNNAPNKTATEATATTSSGINSTEVAGTSTEKTAVDKTENATTSENSEPVDDVEGNQRKKYFSLKKNHCISAIPVDEMVPRMHSIKITDTVMSFKMDQISDGESISLCFALMRLSVTLQKHTSKSSPESTSVSVQVQTDPVPSISAEICTGSCDNRLSIQEDKELSKEDTTTSVSEQIFASVNEQIVETTYLAPKISQASNDGDDECFKVPVPVKRYPRRSVPKVNYTEPDDIELDHYLFCDDCDREWVGDCKTHGPLTVVKDSEIPPGTLRSERALKTLPNGLHVARSMIMAGGYGVWTTKVIPRRTRFGPYKGKIIFKEPEDTRYCWQIKKNEREMCMVDGRSFAHSNWMRYVNCSRFKGELNVFAYQYRGEIYYRTFKDIAPHQELLVWYGKDYGEKLGITTELYKNPDMSKIKNISFHCIGCNVAFSSPLYCDNHAKRCKGITLLVPGVAAEAPPSLHESKDDRTRNVERRVESLSSNSIVDVGRDVSSGLDVCRRYQCTVCSKKFTQKFHLDRHIRVHTGERPFHCTVCSKKFNEKGNLHKHIRVHTGDRPFQCTVCSKKFTQKSDLHRHIRVHTGERPFQCTVCSKKFTQKCDLDRHMRLHTTERFGCTVCSKTYGEKSKLIVHMRVVHSK